MYIQRFIKGKKKRRQKKIIFTIGICIIFIISSIGGYIFTRKKNTIETVSQPVCLVSSGKQYNMSKEEINTYNGQVRKVAYLTFDDGPTIYLPQILDILRRYHVNGTFFMIGNKLKIKSYHPNVRRAIREGNYVSVHSMTHSYRHLYIEGHAIEEMKQALTILHHITGTTPNFVRFPYGTKPGLNSALREQFIETGLKTWDWTVDSLDWSNPHHPERIIQNVKRQVHRQTEVILMHERRQSVQALPQIITYLKQQGYELEVYNEENFFPLNQWHDKRM